MFIPLCSLDLLGVAKLPSSVSWLDWRLPTQEQWNSTESGLSIRSLRSAVIGNLWAWFFRLLIFFLTSPPCKTSPCRLSKCTERLPSRLGTGHWNSSTAFSYRSTFTRNRPRSPVDNVSESPLPALWPLRRACCSSTNQPLLWIRK